MEEKQVIGISTGWKGPLFTDETKKIEKICQRFKLTGVNLKEIGEKIDGFEGIGEPMTEDGYQWFWGMFFRVRSKEVAVLLPYHKERVVAVYIRGKLSIPSSEILEELQDGFVELEKRFSYTILEEWLNRADAIVKRGEWGFLSWRKRRTEIITQLEDLRDITKDLRGSSK